MLIGSHVDPFGLERFRVQALIELLEAATLSGVPVTIRMNAHYMELQWARMQLEAYIEDESRTTHAEMHDDLEHDAAREYDLIEEAEVENDPNQHF